MIAPSTAGIRVGTALRATYVTMGPGGFVYHRRERSPMAAPLRMSEARGEAPLSAAVQDLLRSSPEWLLRDSQARLSRRNWLAVYLVLASLWCLAAQSIVLVVVLALFAVPIALWNRERRLTRIAYDVDDPELQARLALVGEAAAALASAARLWHVAYETPTQDWKRNAGASTLSRRTVTRCVRGALPHFELNVPVWCVPVGPQQLLFLPDRLLVWDGALLAALPYEQLTASATPQRFIEASPHGLPADGRIVDKTWKFLRRDGGPDGRFSGNEELPVMEYGELVLQSPHDLRIALQTSTVAAARLAAAALDTLARRAWAPPPAAPAASPLVAPAQLPPPSPLQLPPPSAAQLPPPMISAPATSPSAAFVTAPVARSVAILLRYLAAADRRIEEAELDFAAQQLRALAPGAPDLDELTTQLRQLPSEPTAIYAAARALAACPTSYRDEVMRALDRIAQIDGKTTPKELERLNELRRWIYSP